MAAVAVAMASSCWAGGLYPGMIPGRSGVGARKREIPQWMQEERKEAAERKRERRRNRGW